MTTVADLVDRVIESWLEPNRRHVMTKLSSSIDSVTTVIPFSFPITLSQGSSIVVDQERILVWTYDSVAQQMTDGIRGYGSSSPATHNAGAMVTKDPRFGRDRVLRALTDEVTGWGADLYRVVGVDLVGAANMSWVDLTTTPAITDALGVVDARIRRNNVGTSLNTTPPQVSQYDRWPRLEYVKIHRNMPVGNFPSGMALKVGEILQGPANIRLMVAMPFNTLSFTESTDVSLIGMTEGQCDVACMGAATRLMWGQEADRSDRTSVGEARRAQEVTVSQTYQQGALLERAYLRRMDAEKAKLQSQYPIRFV